MSENSEYEGQHIKKSGIDIRKLLLILIYRWYIIAASVIICMTIAYLQLRYTTPIYSTVLTLKLDDEKPSQISDLFKYGRTTGKFDNFLNTESEILKSRKFAAKALAEMNLEYTYFVEGNFLTTQLYPNNYFKIITVSSDSTAIGSRFNVDYGGPVSIKISTTENKKDAKTYKVFDTIELPGLSVCIVPIQSNHRTLDKFPTVICEKTNLEDLASSFAGSIGVEIIKGTSLMNLEFTHEVPQMASDYLNKFGKIYISQTVNEKSQAAQQTIDFIDKQLMEMASKVQKNEYDLSDIKSKNKGVEIDEVATTQVKRLSELEADRNIIQINQEFMGKLEKSIVESKQSPINFVVYSKEDALNIPDLLGKYNEALMDRLSILQKNTELSPVALESESKIKELRGILLKTIRNINDKFKLRTDNINRQIAEVNEVLNSIPVRQRVLINIQRDFKVNEKVYSYLFEKKLETSISKSSITPNGSIIEAAELPGAPISPNKNRFYAIALSLGLSIGLGIIAISRLLYQKIPDKETIENISDVKVLGVLKKINNPESNYEIHAFKNPKSIFSESMRSIRTGINFISKGEDKKVICVTSTVSGEGKTFCSINLAASISLLNKKVIIIGGDLRRPKVHLSFSNINNTHGLTTYLIGKSSLEQIIQHTDYENFDVITAGPSPPNPSELLHMKEMKDLLEILKQTYDCIIIDSAPVGLVSDSMILMEMSDINLYVFRAQYSNREFAIIPDKLKSENNIHNVYTILNAYDRNSINYSSIYKNDYSGYQSGGGYHYGGYYGKGGYGYYGKNRKGSYYSGYADEDDGDEPINLFSLGYWKSLFKKD